MTAADIYTQIVSTTSASRTKILEYLNEVASEASELPPRELLAKSGDSQFREPQAAGEKIVSEVLHVLLMQDATEDDPALLEIRDIAQQLVSQTQDIAMWAELIERIHALKPN